MKRNITILYLYTFLSTFILFYATDVLFYVERGVTTSGYLFFIAIIYIIQLLFEIPSGVLADKYGKKRMLILSNILMIISTIIFIFSYNYIFFLVAIIIKGLDNALVTGIVNSMLYDNHKENTKFNKILFVKNTYYNISYMIAMILGGYFAENYSLVINYYITLIPLCINFCILFFLKDTIQKKKEEKILKKDVLKNAFKEIRNNKNIVNFIYTNALIFSILRLLEESHPEYAADMGISYFVIGIYTALILVFCIFGNYIGTILHRKFYKYVFLGSSIVLGVLILLVGLINNFLGIILILLLYIFSESYENITLSYLHENISSKSRVTVESITSAVLSIFGIIISLIVALLSSYYELTTVYIILGSILIGYGLVQLLLNIKKMKF